MPNPEYAEDAVLEGHPIQACEMLSAEVPHLLPVSPIIGSDTSFITSSPIPAKDKAADIDIGGGTTSSDRSTQSALPGDERVSQTEVNPDGASKLVYDIPGLKIPIILKTLRETHNTTTFGGPDLVEVTTEGNTSPVVEISWGQKTNQTVPALFETFQTRREKLVREGKFQKYSNEYYDWYPDRDTNPREDESVYSDGRMRNDIKSHGQLNTSDDNIDSSLLSPYLQPRFRPPPPTPPEAYLPHSLSTPTLPAFHSIADPDLVAAFRTQRRLDPAAFDARTREIQKRHIADKVERGGEARLIHGDYSVELASREDAERVEKWAARRDAVVGFHEAQEIAGQQRLTLTQDTEENRRVILEKTATPEELLLTKKIEEVREKLAYEPVLAVCDVAEQDFMKHARSFCEVGSSKEQQSPPSTSECGPGTVEPKTWTKTNHQENDSEERTPSIAITAPEMSQIGQITTYPARNMYLKATPVNKCTSSGSIRHQHRRKIEETAEQKIITVKTWIEITQEVVMFRDDSYPVCGHSKDIPHEGDVGHEFKYEVYDEDERNYPHGGDTQSDSKRTDMGGEKLSETEAEQLLSHLVEVVSGKNDVGGPVNQIDGVGGLAADLEQTRKVVAAQRIAGKLRIE